MAGRYWYLQSRVIEEKERSFLEVLATASEGFLSGKSMRPGKRSALGNIKGSVLGMVW